MQYALTVNGERITAKKGNQAECPQCHSPVIAKCGEIVSHHWAHESTSDCDNWWEPESPWHRWWKEGLRAEHVEVTMGPHRADIQRADGTVVELQHSQISPEEIRERENFYGKMVWIFDGTTIPTVVDLLKKLPEKFLDSEIQSEIVGVQSRAQLILRNKDNFVTFRWKHPRKHYACPTKPTYIDLGYAVLHLKKIHLEEPPYGGWGYLILKDAMRSWVQEQKTCNTCAHSTQHISENGHNGGFVHCSFMPKWQQPAGKSACQFTPSSWQPSQLPIASMR